MSSWIEVDKYDTTHRCRCGYLKVIATTLEGIQIEHSDSGADVKLPKKGTKLWDTLVTLSAEGETTSGDLTARLVAMKKDYTVSDVSSYLAILRSKGLVEPTTSKRGVKGGSSWVLTSIAEQLLQ